MSLFLRAKLTFLPIFLLALFAIAHADEKTALPKPTPMATLDPSQITQAHQGQIVTTVATVLEVSPSRNDRMPTKLIIRKKPRLVVIYFPSIAASIEQGQGPPSPGERIAVRGMVGTYKGELQIELNSATDIRIEGRSSASPSPGSKLTDDERAALIRAAELPDITGAGNAAQHVGEFITIAGVVVSHAEPWKEGAPSRLIVQDRSGAVEVIYWESSLVKPIDPAWLEPGTPVLVGGQVKPYEDRMQIKLWGWEAVQRVDPERFDDQVKMMTERTKAPEDKGTEKVEEK